MARQVSGTPGTLRRGVGRAWSARLGSNRLTAALVVLALCLSGMAQATYRITRGDTLSSIARRHDTTVKALAEANDIANPNFIIAGRTLVIPGGSSTAGPPSSPGLTTHKVKRGENLTVIARKYKTSIRHLVDLNRISNPSFIRAGQELRVPRAGKPTVEELIVKYSHAYGVDPALVKAMAWQESGWKQQLVSRAGAVGVMQVLPETGTFVGKHLLGAPIDVKKVDDNIRAGVRFLAYLLELTGGDEKLAVGGYFQGLRSINHNGMSPATKRYISNVMALKKRFG